MNVWLVGGDKVIPTSVENAIKGDGYTVKRINGSDRYETAKLIAEAGADISGKKPSKVFVASGESFADALAVSPVAYAKHYAIVLTEKNSTSDFSKKALGNIGSDTKILVGGEAVVSESVAKDLTVSQRISGDDRAVTANLVADWAKKSEGFTTANAALVGGTNGNGADSLVAASVLGKSSTTLHFAGWDATSVYLKDHAAELTGKGVVFGGTAAVTGDQVNKAQAAAQTAVSNQSIKVTPSDAKTLTIPSTEDKTDDRVYSVAGLSGDVEYRVTLVNAANISVDKSGNVTFKSSVDTASKSGFSADPGTRASRITVVNGSPITADVTAVANAVSGNLSFTVDGGAVAEDIVPVVYVNGGPGKTVAQGGPSTRLETSATEAGGFAAPTEAYGLGGTVSYLPTEATTADFNYTASNALAEANDGNVALVRGDTFVAENAGTGVGVQATYNFDSNDKFYIEKDASGVAGFGTADSDEQVTYKEFKAQLSKNDNILGTSYQRTPEFQSTFLLSDDSPAAPAVTVGTITATTIPLSIASFEEGATVDVFLASGTTANFNTDKTPYTAIAKLTKADDTDKSDADIDYTITVPGNASATTDYRVAVTQTVDGEASLADNDSAQTPIIAESVRPTITNAELSTVGGSSGLLDSGDVITVDFSEAMAAAAGGSDSFIRVSDKDSVYEISGSAVLGNGSGNAVNNDQVVITLTASNGNRTLVSGTDNGLDLAGDTVKITLMSNDYKDVAGNLIDLSKSSDVVVDDE